jgi:hypothetical protein
LLGGWTGQEIFSPQVIQNCAPGSTGLPHLAQKTARGEAEGCKLASGVPQLRQYKSPAWFNVRQDGQTTLDAGVVIAGVGEKACGGGGV